MTAQHQTGPSPHGRRCDGGLLTQVPVTASRTDTKRARRPWHLAHAGTTKLALAIVVLALGFAALLTL
jgi:hypothetical protein